MKNRTVKVGILCPYSTIYPALGRNFMDGIMSGIPTKLHDYYYLVPEFVNQGEPSALKPSIEKLFGFDNVDFLTGFVGYRSIKEMIPIIDRFKITSVFCDLGEYIPFLDNQSDYLYFNSLNYWQAEFALGKWAQSQFGGRGAVFAPIYDIGYHMHSSFRQGALQVENCTLEYAVPRFDNQSDYNVRDAMEEYMQKFKKERPSYIHAIFSGSEAKEFFEVYHEHGLHKEIPLIVSPHMASYEVLKDVQHMDMTFYSSSLWSLDSGTKENMRFKRDYLSSTGEMANIFSLLGYEIGQLLELAYPYLSQRRTHELHDVIREESIRTPRGERNFYQETNYSVSNVDIEKIRLENNTINNLIVEEGKPPAFNSSIFKEIHQENVSGWFNPYLCV